MALLSGVDPKKGQDEVKLGKISIAKTLLQKKTCLPYPVLRQDFRNFIYFHVQRLEIPKMEFQKETPSPYLFLPLRNQK